VVERKSAASTFIRISQLLELLGEDVFRVRAFQNAARAVERFEGSIEAAIESGEILQLKGIGKGTARVLEELAGGTEPAVLTQLLARTPEGLLEVLALPGLGPKRVRAIWQELGVTGIGELEYACRENRLVDLPGFGPKTQKKLLDAIAFANRSRQWFLLSEAWAVGQALRAVLSETTAVERVEVSGQVRRQCEIADKVELVVASRDRVSVLTELKGLLEVSSDDAEGIEGYFDGHFPVRVWLVDESKYLSALLRSTGSSEHVEALQKRLKQNGIELSRLSFSRGGMPLVFSDEGAVYSAAGCSPIPPELREGRSEIELAARESLPQLVNAHDLLGALHNHTTFSDGLASLEEMAGEAGRLGWQYVGIADHSQAAFYANGLDGERLREQIQSIDRLNAEGRYPRILKGIEADILPDGSLDLPDGCEAELDYVVASVHSSFELPEQVQTERVLRAVKHPACRVLGHPTGRLLLARPGFAVDLEAVLAACAQHNVAAEINASPYRLDLDWLWARRAIELGVKLVINPDAHSTEGLADLRWGLAVARKAGARAEDILNTRPNAGLAEDR
jgi:DNA polymerase (family 10)